jgi:hypothetical protein
MATTATRADGTGKIILALTLAAKTQRRIKKKPLTFLGKRLFSFRKRHFGLGFVFRSFYQAYARDKKDQPHNKGNEGVEFSHGNAAHGAAAAQESEGPPDNKYNAQYRQNGPEGSFHVHSSNLLRW